MSAPVYRRFSNEFITSSMVFEAAALFGAHYGVWSPTAVDQEAGPLFPSLFIHRSFLMHSYTDTTLGARVKFTPQTLARTHLPKGADVSLALVYISGQHVGHAFACYWTVYSNFGPPIKVGWVTQLVVHSDFRRQGLATELCRLLRKGGVVSWGILSSHPAAVMAMAKGVGHGIDEVDLKYMQRCAWYTMNASPIRYVRDAPFSGSLFGFSLPKMSDNVASADTRFYVDHAEPQAALKMVKAHGRWPLGGLEPGHEYLLIIQAKALPAVPTAVEWMFRKSKA